MQQNDTEDNKEDSSRIANEQYLSSLTRQYTGPEKAEDLPFEDVLLTGSFVRQDYKNLKYVPDPLKTEFVCNEALTSYIEEREIGEKNLLIKIAKKEYEFIPFVELLPKDNDYIIRRQLTWPVDDKHLGRLF